MSSRRKTTRIRGGRHPKANTTLPPIPSEQINSRQVRKNVQPHRSFTVREPQKNIVHPDSRGIKRDSTSITLKRRESLLAYEPVMAKFVKNGDKFFEGLKVNISKSCIKSWDALLAELSQKIALPSGVRTIYTPENGHKITQLSELEHQGTYVCGSTEPFRKIDYLKTKHPEWKAVSKMQVSDSHVMDFGSSWRSTRANFNLKSSFSEHYTTPKKYPHMLEPITKHSLSTPDETLEDDIETSPTPTSLEKPPENIIEITVFRNGPPPRNRIKVTLDKYSQSWEDVKKIVSERFVGINGCLRLFSLNGEQVLGLHDLWRAGSMVIAVGAETFSIAKFLTGDEDPSTTVVTPYQTPTERSLNKLKSAPKDESVENITQAPIQALVDSQTKLHQSVTDEGDSDVPNPKAGHESTYTKQLTFTPDNHADTAQQHKIVISSEHDQTQLSLESQPKFSGPKLRNAQPAFSFDSPTSPVSPLFGSEPAMENGEIEIRPRTLSLLNDKFRELQLLVRSDSVCSSSDEYEMPADERKKKFTIPLYKRYESQPYVLPKTPQSDIGLGGIQSMIDMIIPKMFHSRTDSILSSTSQSSDSYQSAEKQSKRSIGIQTDYVSDHLSTIIDVDYQDDNTVKACPLTSATCIGYTWNQKVVAHNKILSIYDHQLNRRTKEKYHIEETLREGRFASVKVCKEKANGKEYFLRVINKSNVFWHDDLLLREIRIITRLNHQNIMKVSDQWESSDDISLVMEPFEGSDLYDCIQHCKSFSERDTAEVLNQLGLALVYLHANRIVHRDIRPENIFMSLLKDGNWILQLCGFSLATIASEPLSLICSKQCYRSPEMVFGTGYGTKSDVWAAGVICYLLLSGRLPFRRKSESNVFTTRSTGNFPSPYWATVSDCAKDFIQHLLKPSPHGRYSSSEMLQHPWLFNRKKSTEQSSESRQKLIDHIANKAAEDIDISSILILGVTALDS